MRRRTRAYERDAADRVGTPHRHHELLIDGQRVVAVDDQQTGSRLPGCIEQSGWIIDFSMFRLFTGPGAPPAR